MESGNQGVSPYGVTVEIYDSDSESEDALDESGTPGE